MSARIFTLFGEEIIPEQTVAVGKSRARKQKAVVVDETKAEKTKPTNSKIVTEYDDLLLGWQPEKQYYTIGEVANLFQVNTSHIRFWTKEFSIKVRTTKKGDRLYTANHIYEIRTIYHLVKQKGYTLAGAKQKLKETKKKTTESVNLKQSLLKLRNQLTSIRNQLG